MFFLFHDHVTLECLSVSSAQVLVPLLDSKTLLSLDIGNIGISRLFIWCDVDLSAFVIKLFEQCGEILLH